MVYCQGQIQQYRSYNSTERGHVLWKDGIPTLHQAACDGVLILFSFVA